MRAVIVFGMIASLCACSSVAKKEDICHATIKKTLINPETAEFFETTPLSKAEFDEAMIGVVTTKYKLRRSEWSNYKGSLQPEYDENLAAAHGLKDVSYQRTRMKADSTVGMRITSNWLCATDGKSVCGCGVEPSTD